MAAQLLQKIVSGENVTLPQKGIDPWEGKWLAHLAFGGNEMFKLQDKAGALARRAMVFNVYRPVPDELKNLEMPELLTLENPNMIHKTTCAYLEKRKQVGKGSLWSHVSGYFLDQRDTVMAETNPFYSFITSDQVALGLGYYVDVHDFRVAYNHHLKQLGMGRDRFSKDTYIGPFAKLSGSKGFEIGIKIGIKMDTMDEQGNVIEGKETKDYVIGLKLA
jgi:hypothetical protein